MQLSSFLTLAAAVPAILARHLLVHTEGQSQNLDILSRQVGTYWVWACDGPNFTGNCGSVFTLEQDTCHRWSDLFPGIGNGSFRTNSTSFALWFWDGSECSGTQSARVCNGDELSRTGTENNCCYAHTNSIYSTP